MAQTPNRARRGRSSLSSNHASKDPRLAAVFRAGTRLEDFEPSQFQQDKNGRVCIRPEALLPEVGTGLEIVNGKVQQSVPKAVSSVPDKTGGTVSKNGTIQSISNDVSAVVDVSTAATAIETLAQEARDAIATLAAQVEALRKSQQGV